MDALADIGVRQHGFCEWMSGLDNLKIIQPHRWKIFKIAGDKPYSDINKEVTILGLKEYKKLESNKYTDTSKKWKKFEIIYDGWKDIDNISIKAEFTPKDLSAPLIYNPYDYL